MREETEKFKSKRREGGRSEKERELLGKREFKAFFYEGSILDYCIKKEVQTGDHRRWEKTKF